MRVQFTATGKEKGLSAAEIVHMRAKNRCIEQRQDPNNFQFINAATIEVLKADKGLGEAYKLLWEPDAEDEE